ncbi:lanosterol 14-alpha-demethylase [Wolfiporia cocos MD-104 SS10]|uniref:Lanosterol 14-alpha-demethylase n=1 Tax=Wolfiporia cocos (strain MD-104) TaxID=742152 RepID=A0A2H3JUC9_WOLCO|nr:lanosterol 14-alpha-demethylase [Wolfiporia cocos MD-104 SS10]
MSLVANFSDPWAGYLDQAQTQLASASLSRLALLVVINLPAIAVALNVLYQMLPRDRSLPPLVFHWIPWFGSAAQYGQDPVEFFKACREKYGNVFTFVLLGRRVTVALGPKGNDLVFGSKHTIVAAEEVYSPLTTPVFGKDVVYDCPNELLMEQKKFVKVSLTTDKFREYIGMIEDEVTQFMDNDPAFRIFQLNDINEWGAFSAYKTLAEITVLTAARTLQGKEVRSNMDKGFAELYHDLDHGLTPLHWMFSNLPLPSYRKRDIAQEKMSQFYQNILRSRRDSNGDYEDDVMASLMTQHYRDGRPVPDHEIAHMMIALLMAGQHTSSSSTSWVLLHLADRPDVTEQLYQEQVEHFGLPGGGFRDMTYEDLKKLPILEAVVRETLRIHAPIHSIMRYVRSDLPVPPTLGAPTADSCYVVPKGYTVLASPALSQMDPLIWQNAGVWDPARWYDQHGMAAMAKAKYDEDSKVDFGFGLVSKGTDSPYLPFGAGRHRCIGEQFALLQIGVIIATIVRKIELRLEGPFPKPDYSSMMVVPQEPCQVCYRRRKFD